MPPTSDPILVTMPGKYGDILWSLPTARAIANATSAPVDVMVAKPYLSLVPLLQQQPYIRVAMGNVYWEVQDTAPMTPSAPPRLPTGLGDYQKVINLGLTSWPEHPLAHQCYENLLPQWPDAWGTPPPLDLEEPWITVAPDHDFSETHVTYAEYGAEDSVDVHIGWSDDWIELKAGLTYALTGRMPNVRFRVITHSGSRLCEEWLRHYPGGDDCIGEQFDNLSWYAGDWLLTAHAMSNSKIFVGCLSAQWVLANAMGKPTVIAEPATGRHHPAFWRAAGKNHLVLGSDHLPTFDARHLGDVVKEVLGG
jgi:hypothetical protein